MRTYPAHHRAGPDLGQLDPQTIQLAVAELVGRRARLAAAASETAQTLRLHRGWARARRDAAEDRPIILMVHQQRTTGPRPAA